MKAQTRTVKRYATHPLGGTRYCIQSWEEVLVPNRIGPFANCAERPLVWRPAARPSTRVALVVIRNLDSTGKETAEYPLDQSYDKGWQIASGILLIAQQGRANETVCIPLVQVERFYERTYWMMGDRETTDEDEAYQWARV